jgi:hypothetical protein
MAILSTAIFASLVKLEVKRWHMAQLHCLQMLILMRVSFFFQAILGPWTRRVVSRRLIGLAGPRETTLFRASSSLISPGKSRLEA